MHWVTKKRKRKLLHEAFIGGWQAALGANIRSPRVLEVVESCFELWLEDATGEVDVLGLRFRRRWDLPKTTLPPETLARYRQAATVGPRIPAQRRASEDLVAAGGTHRRTGAP